MAREPALMQYEEFAGNLDSVLRRVVRKNEAVVVETAEGARVLLTAVPRGRAALKGRTTRSADEAFLSAFGGWRDIVDADLLKEELAAARGSSRPPVDLLSTSSTPIGWLTT